MRPSDYWPLIQNERETRASTGRGSFCSRLTLGKVLCGVTTRAHRVASVPVEAIGGTAPSLSRSEFRLSWRWALYSSRRESCATNQSNFMASRIQSGIGWGIECRDSRKRSDQVKKMQPAGFTLLNDSESSG